MQKRWIVVLAALAFLVTLVLHAPAAQVYAWTQDPARPAAVRLHGVYGTVARGGFAALSVNQRLTLRDAQWRLQPAWLALLRLTADVEAGDEAVVRARVSRSVFGTLQLSRLGAAGSARTLLQMLGQPPLPIEGQARLDLPLVRLDGGVPVEARGAVEIENLAWTVARDPIPLGSVNVALATDPQGIVASFGSGPGPLEVGGSAVLKPDRSYELDLQVRPRGGAPETTATLVRSLGPPDGKGWHHFRRQGTLQ